MKLNEVFREWATGKGIFHFLDSYEVPWNSENTSIATELDLHYHGNISGEKHVSPLVEKIVSIPMTDTEAGTLAKTIFTMFGKNWSKLWETLNYTYNPIENYSMTETHTGTDTETQTPTDWKETETQTPTDWKETETQTPTEWKETNSSLSANNERNDNSYIYAFNSTDAVPIGKTDSTVKTKTETERTGTYETERERTGTYETERERTGTYETETLHNTTLTRSGNIGVTTSQQMIASQRELWFWNYFETIFKDIDKVLCLKIY